MHEQFCDLGRYERFVIPSDGPLEQVLGNVRSAIANRQFQLED